jgi:acetoacetyl-CoA synthetase
VIDSAFCSTGKILDCLAVGQTIGSDEKVVLFVKLPDNETLTPALVREIQGELRARRSARHVPSVVSYIPQPTYLSSLGYKVIAAPVIAYTINGKKIETLIKKVRCKPGPSLLFIELKIF